MTKRTLTGWTVGDGSSTDGYHAEDYFGPGGEYLGPDEHGIEPIFAEEQPQDRYLDELKQEQSVWT